MHIIKHLKILKMKEEKLKVIFIDSKNKTVTDILIDNGNDDEISNQIRGILKTNHTANLGYLNDEGDNVFCVGDIKLTDEKSTFFSYATGIPIQDDALIMGYNMVACETVSCHINADEIKDNIKFYTYQEAMPILLNTQSDKVDWGFM